MTLSRGHQVSRPPRLPSGARSSANPPQFVGGAAGANTYVIVLVSFSGGRLIAPHRWHAPCSLSEAASLVDSGGASRLLRRDGGFGETPEPSQGDLRCSALGGLFGGVNALGIPER